MNFTKHERAVILAAWNNVTTYSMPSSVRAQLEEALSAERKAFFTDKPSQIECKGRVLSWFVNGMCKPETTIAEITGTRVSHLIAIVCGAHIAAMRWNGPVDMPTLNAAVAAYEAAHDRDSDQRQAEFRAALAAYNAARRADVEA